MAGFDLNALFQQAQQIQEQMKEAQERLERKIVTGSSGGGMVIVTASGKGEIQKVATEPTTEEQSDAPVLEHMARAAMPESGFSAAAASCAALSAEFTAWL